MGWVLPVAAMLILVLSAERRSARRVEDPAATAARHLESTTTGAVASVMGQGPRARGPFRGVGVDPAALETALQGARQGPTFPWFSRPAQASGRWPGIEGPGPREFYFTRVAYSGHGGRSFSGSWRVDYPKADRQFLIGLQRLVNHLDAYELEHPILLTDERLGRFPFLYAVEVGYMALTEGEAQGLRRYLLSGGFLVVDDFWGTAEWENFEAQIRRVLPEYPIVDLKLDHPLFHCFYDVQQIYQVPNVGQGRAGGPTYERDGYWPEVKGIFDHQDRLLVVISWNSDLGDAWEWAEDPYYPLKFSTYAYQMGVNLIVYAMSH